MHNRKLLRTLNRCDSFCTADSYDLIGLSTFFRKKGYIVRLSRDVLHVTSSKKPDQKKIMDLFFFNYGCFVAWGCTKNFEDKLLEYVKPFAIHPDVTIETDHFHFRYGDESTIDTHEKLKLDIISLDSDDPQIKLGISYGLSQSIKLESFEEAVQQVVRQSKHIPEEIADKGTISLSRRAIFKRIGEIFITRSSINLSLEYLDVPEFFWRNPNLEPFYIMTKKFLDIPSRVMALNQKLDVLQELLDILNSQVQHRHSSMLELIIIILIFAEILISLFQLHVV